MHWSGTDNTEDSLCHMNHKGLYSLHISLGNNKLNKTSLSLDSVFILFLCIDVPVSLLIVQRSLASDLTELSQHISHRTEFLLLIKTVYEKNRINLCFG